MGINVINITYFTTGTKEDIACEFTLMSENNSNIINFDCDKFHFRICLKDVVDLEDFLNAIKVYTLFAVHFLK